MRERAYTVPEIDDLRRACSRRWLYGTTYLEPGSDVWSRSYNPTELAAGTEELVRTYMLAGLTAEDIYAADRPQPNGEQK